MEIDEAMNIYRTVEQDWFPSQRMNFLLSNGMCEFKIYSQVYFSLVSFLARSIYGLQEMGYFFHIL